MIRRGPGGEEGEAVRIWRKRSFLPKGRSADQNEGLSRGREQPVDLGKSEAVFDCREKARVRDKMIS